MHYSEIIRKPNKTKKQKKTKNEEIIQNQRPIGAEIAIANQANPKPNSAIIQHQRLPEA